MNAPTFHQRFVAAPHWRLVGVLLCVLLGVIYAVAPGDTRAEAHVPFSCPTAELIGVRGSGEHSSFGHTIGSLVNDVGIPGVRADAIDYPAVNVNPLEPAYNRNYMDSVTAGINALYGFIVSFQERCPVTPLLLAGYSQGAEVVDDAFLGPMSNKQQASVAGVVLFGDPRFNPDQELPVDAGTFNHRFAGVSIYQFRPAVGTFGTLVNYPASAANVVRSYCANHDPICGFSTPAQALSCKLKSCAHYHYADLIFGQPPATYTHAAGNFLVSRWLAKQTPGTASFTGYGGTTEARECPQVPFSDLYPRTPGSSSVLEIDIFGHPAPSCATVDRELRLVPHLLPISTWGPVDGWICSWGVLLAECRKGNTQIDAVNPGD